MSAQYIKAEPVIRQFEELTRSRAGTWTGVAYGNALQLLKDAPKEDPVHAAGGCYCKECKHWNPVHEHIPHYECGVFNGNYDHGYPTKADDFCSYGERRQI